MTKAEGDDGTRDAFDAIGPDTRFVPEPIANVWESIDAIMDAYMKTRPEYDDPITAMLAAMQNALPAEAFQEGYAFMKGEMDELFRAGQGAEFVDLLVDMLEQHYVAQRIIFEAPVGYALPQPTNLVDLAEWLGTNEHSTFAYRRALDESPKVAKFLLDSAVADILTEAAKARTKMGRKVKVEQAEKVLALLSRKARAVTGNVAAANQATWCDAMVASLKRLFALNWGA